MTKWGSFPLGIGNRIELIIHDPIPVKAKPFAELFCRNRTNCDPQ